MTSGRSRVRRIISHPIAEAVNLGGNLVVVIGAVAAGIALVVGLVLDQPLAAMGLGLVLSFVVSLALAWRTLNLERAMGELRTANDVKASTTLDNTQADLLRVATRAVARSFERFETDNNGTDAEAEGQAREALTEAVAAATEIANEPAREAVFAYRDVFEQTPSGYKASTYGRRGAGTGELEALRASHKAALDALGAALRGV